MSGEDLSSNHDYTASPHHPHIREVNDSHFTSPSAISRQPRSHLVLNNFLASSGDKCESGFKPRYANHHQINQVENDPGESESRNSHSNFLYVYFFFAYYLCLTPFRLKKVTAPAQHVHPTFEIHEYLPQKLLCAIANILALARYSVEFRRCIQEIKRENPISFFKLFEASSSLIFKTVILRCFWKNKGKFLRVVRFLDNAYILPYNKFKIESIYTISTLCTFYVVIGFARMITGSGFLRPSATWSPSWWARRLVAEARYSFFLSNASHFDIAPTHNDISSFDIILAVITGLTFQCRFLAGYFVDVGILLCVLSLWAPVSGFSANIHRQLKKRAGRDSSLEDEVEGRGSGTALNKISPSHQMEYVQEVVMQQYKALKMLTGLISEANGTTILPFISEAIFGYAIFFEDVLISKDFFHRVILICFYFCAVNILVFSADVCRKMQAMKMWLWDEERFSAFPSQRLMMVLHDLSTNSVGITATGIFTIDFYLVGSMISVLITLFIIRLQYQSLDA